MPAESFVRYFFTTTEFYVLLENPLLTVSLLHAESLFNPLHPLSMSGVGTFFLLGTFVFIPHSMFVCSMQKEEEEEGEQSDAEEQVPEATERKEHATCGQTGVDNVQSAQAVELAGAAPEKEQGKEVMGLSICLESCSRQQVWFLCYCVRIISHIWRDCCLPLYVGLLGNH